MTTPDLYAVGSYSAKTAQRRYQGSNDNHNKHLIGASASFRAKEMTHRARAVPAYRKKFFKDDFFLFIVSLRP